MIDSSSSGCCWLGQLPDEVVLSILYYVDERDLLSLAKVDRGLRGLACDKCLHMERIRYSKWKLGKWLPQRVLPTSRNSRDDDGGKDGRQIILRQRYYRNPVAIKVHMVIIKTRLNRKLRLRPQLQDITARSNILVSSDKIASQRQALERAIVRDTIARFIRQSLVCKRNATTTGSSASSTSSTFRARPRNNGTSSSSCAYNNNDRNTNPNISYLIRWFKVREQQQQHQQQQQQQHHHHHPINRYSGDYWFSQYIQVEKQRNLCPTRAKVHNMTKMFEKLNV